MTQETPIGRIKSDPFTERLGIRNEIGEDGACITTHQCGVDECNIYGVVHGALLFAMADVGMGMALAAALSDTPRLGSISISAYYISAAKPGLIMAISRVLKRSSSVALLTTDIRDGEGVECARFSGIFHIYPNGAKEV